MNTLSTCAGLAALMLAATAHAGDTASPASTSAASSKVGIDRATGRLRPLTEEESAVLDATVVVTPTRMKSSPMAAAAASMPLNEDEVIATMRTLPSGGIVMKAPQSAMSTLVATRNAQGQLVIQHEGDETHETPRALEATSE